MWDFICVYVFGYFIAWAILVSPHYYNTLKEYMFREYGWDPADAIYMAGMIAIASWFFVLFAAWESCCRIIDYFKKKIAIRKLVRVCTRLRENGDVLGAEEIMDSIRRLQNK